jgi:hypothetical protein
LLHIYEVGTGMGFRPGVGGLVLICSTGAGEGRGVGNGVGSCVGAGVGGLGPGGGTLNTRPVKSSHSFPNSPTLKNGYM